MAHTPWRARRTTLAMLALIAVLTCAKLIYFEEWLFANDNFATLGTFFRSATHSSYQRAARLFQQTAVEACEPQDKPCIGNASLAFVEQTYARPITAFFGSFLPRREWLSSDTAFLTGVTKLTAGYVVAGTLIAVLLLACFVLALPPPAGALVAGSMALFGVASYWLFLPAPFRDFQPFKGLGFGSALAALLIAIVAWLLAKDGSRRVATLPSLKPDRLMAIFWLSALGLFLLRAAALAAPKLLWEGKWLGSGVGPFPLFLLLAGITVFLAAVAFAADKDDGDPDVTWIGAFLLFGFIAVGKDFFAATFYMAAKGSIYLLAPPIMLYAAFRPNGRMLLLLPALMLFHVSIAGLLYLCISATEAIACFRRRRVSLALVVSALLFVACVAYTMTSSQNPLGLQSTEEFGAWIGHVNWWYLLPGVLVLSILAYAGYLAWQMPDPAGDLLLRAIVLAAMLAGAGQVAVALMASGFVEAGYDRLYFSVFMLYLLSNYLGPIVCGAGTFLVIFALGTAGGGADARSLVLDWRTMSVLLAGVLALASVRSDNGISRPYNVLAALASGARLVATQNPPKPPDPDIRIAASPDDHYLVGETALNVVSMTSILKMKARSTSGMLDPHAVTVTSVKKLAREFYLGKDPTTKKCKVVTEKPDGQTMMMIGTGTYATKEEAKAAKRTLADCKKKGAAG